MTSYHLPQASAGIRRNYTKSSPETSLFSSSTSFQHSGVYTPQQVSGVYTPQQVSGVHTPQQAPGVSTAPFSSYVSSAHRLLSSSAIPSSSTGFLSPYFSYLSSIDFDFHTLYKRVFVGTFHRFGIDVLRKYGRVLGIPSTFQTAGNLRQSRIAKSVIETFKKTEYAFSSSTRGDPSQLASELHNGHISFQRLHAQHLYSKKLNRILLSSKSKNHDVNRDRKEKEDDEVKEERTKENEDLDDREILIEEADEDDLDLDFLTEDEEDEEDEGEDDRGRRPFSSASFALAVQKKHLSFHPNLTCQHRNAASFSHPSIPTASMKDRGLFKEQNNNIRTHGTSSQMRSSLSHPYTIRGERFSRSSSSFFPHRNADEGEFERRERGMKKDRRGGPSLWKATWKEADELLRLVRRFKFSASTFSHLLQKENPRVYSLIVKYQEALQSHSPSLLDYSDLLLYTLRLLDSYPDIQRDLHRSYPIVLVDEFQDTSLTQFRILKLLMKGRSTIGDEQHINHSNFASSSSSSLSSVEGSQQIGGLTVVGDDDQSIYAFRGIDGKVKTSMFFMEKQVYLERHIDMSISLSLSVYVYLRIRISSTSLMEFYGSILLLRKS